MKIKRSSPKEKNTKKEKRREARGRPKESTQINQRQNKQAKCFNNRKMEKCYNCVKKGHYARDCWHKKVKGNVATSTQSKKDEEEAWDCETPYTVEETNQQEEFVTCHLSL